MSFCRSCGAIVVWSKTENSKNIPLDPEPVLGGNIILECNGALARVVEPDPGIRRHISHFVTCPNAAHHRSPR